MGCGLDGGVRGVVSGMIWSMAGRWIPPLPVVAVASVSCGIGCVCLAGASATIAGFWRYYCMSIAKRIFRFFSPVRAPLRPFSADRRTTHINAAAITTTRRRLHSARCWRDFRPPRGPGPAQLFLRGGHDHHGRVSGASAGGRCGVQASDRRRRWQQQQQQ